MWQVSGRSDITDFEEVVRLPLRVNWGGGWSDTPPYCNEKGGTVLNAAILLNGEKPVEVTLERIPEQKVVFDSRDMDVHGEFLMNESWHPGEKHRDRKLDSHLYKYVGCQTCEDNEKRIYILSPTERCRTTNKVTSMSRSEMFM